MKITLLASLFVLIFLSGCSPQESDTSASSEKISTEAGSTLSAVETVDGVTTVRIGGNDRMQFTVTEFSAKAGDTVRIIFENNGKMPVTAMGHNVVVLKQGVDANAFAGKAAMARDNEFIPASEVDSVIANTQLLGPDESETIEFVALKPGNYEYLCTFPAHCFAGMRGIMTVVE